MVVQRVEYLYHHHPHLGSPYNWPETSWPLPKDDDGKAILLWHKTKLWHKTDPVGDSEDGSSSESKTSSREPEPAHLVLDTLSRSALFQRRYQRRLQQERRRLKTEYHQAMRDHIRVMFKLRRSKSYKDRPVETGQWYIGDPDW